jgi:hypothetical protein
VKLRLRRKKTRFVEVHASALLPRGFDCFGVSSPTLLDVVEDMLLPSTSLYFFLSLFLSLSVSLSLCRQGRQEGMKPEGMKPEGMKPEGRKLRKEGS